MKNLMLRAMRTLDESICAPEYANNQLAIEMLFPEPPASMNELSVQVYSKDYRLMGADVYTPSSQKIPRKYALRCFRIRTGTMRNIVYLSF